MPLIGYAKIENDKDKKINLYLNVFSGEITAVRSLQWRIWDLMWGFHIMDWQTRDKINNIFLKITEKEIDFIEILNSSSKPLSREFILKNIWNYSTDTDTHTVETHIYRLRQKIKDKFEDSNFIKNSKKGYSL